jgi:hypothetical protein
MPWAAAKISPDAAAYNAALIEAACEYAKMVRAQHKRSTEVTGAGPSFAASLKLKELKTPPSPFKDDIFGGEPFAPVVVAPDGTHAVDLAPLTAYLHHLEQQVGHVVGQDRERIAKMIQDACAQRYNTSWTPRHSTATQQQRLGSDAPRSNTSQQAPKVAAKPGGKRNNGRFYNPKAGGDEKDDKDEGKN